MRHRPDVPQRSKRLDHHLDDRRPPRDDAAAHRRQGRSVRPRLHAPVRRRPHRDHHRHRRHGRAPRDPLHLHLPTAGVRRSPSARHAAAPRRRRRRHQHAIHRHRLHRGRHAPTLIAPRGQSPPTWQIFPSATPSLLHRKTRNAMKYTDWRPDSSARRRPRGAATVAAAAAVISLLASCSSTGGKPQENGGGMGGGTAADTPRVTIAMVTHEVPGDSFWDLIRKGAETAAKKDNIELRYSNDPEAPNQANLVQTAVDSGVKGIAVTLAKPDAMRAAVQAAEAKGIPVVAFNAGLKDWQAMGVKEYFGQDGNIAGQSAGDRLTKEGAKKAICVIQEQGHVDLEARCAGLKTTFPATENLNVNGKDMPSVESTITAKLQQDPSIDYVVALGAPFALAAVQSAKNAGSKAKIGTFDTNAALVDAIKNGDVQWAVDQQPFLQGYLSVDSLWLYINNGNVIGGGQPTLTGPAFIEKSNVDAVAEYAKNGTR